MIKEGFLGQRMIVLPNAIREQLLVNQITRTFYITDIGFYPNAHKHRRVRKNGTPEYIFIHCIQGSGIVQVGGRSIEVTSNSFFIIPRDAAHSYEANQHDPWSIYWLHFDGEGATSLYDRYNHSNKSATTTPFESKRIELFTQIFDMLQSDYTSKQLEYASILGLHYISLFVYPQIEQNMQKTNSNHLIDGVIQFLSENLDKSYKSEDIAAHFNYSSSYLFNQFKKRTGYSLIHFFNLKKIQKACEYLKYTDLSIKEISFKMSFQDPLYFSRTFKKYIGVSPRAYRYKQHG